MMRFCWRFWTRAEEYAVKLKEIMERIGSELLHPVPVKAEVRVMKSLEE